MMLFLAVLCRPYGWRHAHLQLESMREAALVGIAAVGSNGFERVFGVFGHDALGLFDAEIRQPAAIVIDMRVLLEVEVERRGRNAHFLERLADGDVRIGETPGIDPLLDALTNQLVLGQR